jgi:hypothetical protein
MYVEKLKHIYTTIQREEHESPAASQRNQRNAANLAGALGRSSCLCATLITIGLFQTFHIISR